MAHCKRCNRFMVFGRKSGYCETCEVVVKIDTENRRKAEEQERKEEAARRCCEEAEQANLENKKQANVDEDEKTPAEKNDSIENVEPVSTEGTERIEIVRETVETVPAMNDENNIEISQEISLDENKNQEDLHCDKYISEGVKRSIAAMSIQEKTEALLYEQLRTKTDTRMLSERNQTDIEKYNPEEGEWNKHFTISYRTNLFVLIVSRDSAEEQIVNDLIEDGKASRHSNYPLPKIAGKVCCFVKSQNAEEVIKSLTSSADAELTVSEDKNVSEENRESIEETAGTPKSQNAEEAIKDLISSADVELTVSENKNVSEENRESSEETAGTPKPQNAEEAIKSLTSLSDAELTVSEDKNVSEENKESIEETAGTPVICGQAISGTQAVESEKTILYFTFWLQTYHRDKTKDIPQYTQSIQTAYKHLLCKRIPTEYDAEEIERDADYVLEIFKKDYQWASYDLYRDSFCLFEEFLGGSKLKRIPASEDLQNGAAHHEYTENETASANASSSDSSTGKTDSVENDKENIVKDVKEEHADANDWENVRNEEQSLISGEDAKAREAKIQKQVDELDAKIRQYRTEIVRMTAERDRLLAEKKEITGKFYNNEEENIASTSEKEITQSLEQPNEKQAANLKKTVTSSSGEENESEKDEDIQALDPNWDEDSDEGYDEKIAQQDESAIRNVSSTESNEHAENDLIVDYNADENNTVKERNSEILRKKAESILTKIVAEKQNVSIVPRESYTTIRRRMMSGTRNWQIIATVSYRSFVAVVEVSKEAPEAENARIMLALGKVSSEYLGHSLPEKNNRIAFFAPEQKIEDIFDELLLDINIATVSTKAEANSQKRLDEMIRQAAGQYASIPLDRLGLSRRAYNGLLRDGIETLGELLDLSEERLFSIRNLGAMSVGEITRRRNEIIATVDKVSAETYGQRKENVSEEKDVEENNAIAEDAFDDEDSVLCEIISSVPLDEISLSVRAYNALIHGGITNTEELMHLSDQEIMNYKRVGYKTAAEIYDKKNELESEHNRIKEKIKNIPPMIKDSIREYQQAEGVLSNRKLIALVLRICADTDDMDDENAISILSSNDKLVSACVELLEDEITRAEFNGIRKEELTALLPDFLNGEDCELGSACFDRINADEDFYCIDDCYFRKLRSFSDFVDSIPDERTRFVIQERAQGKTLEEIANSQELSRERIRQIEAKFWRTAPVSERFLEDKYIRLLENYQIDDKTFRVVFDEPREVWYYAKNRSKKDIHGNASLEDAAFDDTLPSEIREAVRDFYDNFENASYLQFGEERVPARRTDLEAYVLRHYCNEIMSIDDFFDLYNHVLCEAGYDTSDYLISDSMRRTREIRIAELPYVLWSYNRRMRYYPFEKYDMNAFIRGLELNNYKDIEISARKLMVDHPDLMQAYDIRNEYELHNLLKKQGAEEMIEGLRMGKMPMIQIGDTNRTDFILDMLFALAPISMDDFVNAVSERTGIRPEIVRSKNEYVNAINVYLHDGMLTIDSEAMPEEEMCSLLDALTNDYYSFEEIRNAYMHVTGRPDAELVSPYNLKRMGFKVYSGYVLRNYNNIDAYFTDVLTKTEIVDYSEYAKRFSNVTEFMSVLNRLKDTFEVVEFEPGQLIRKDRLQRFGVDEIQLKAFWESVYQYVEPGQYFTIQSLKNDGFESSLFNLGFDNWFYSSVLREDTRFGSRRLGAGYPVLLFCRDVPKVTRQGFIEFLLDGKSMDRDELLDEIKKTYDIVFDKEDITTIISDSDIYYDAIMEKVYANKELYYEEM